MHIDFCWYRVEYRESWDVENRLHVAYVSALEGASRDCIHFKMYKQFHFPISTDAYIQIEKFTPVEKTIVDDEQGLTNTK